MPRYRKGFDKGLQRIHRDLSFDAQSGVRTIRPCAAGFSLGPTEIKAGNPFPLDLKERPFDSERAGGSSAPFRTVDTRSLKSGPSRKGASGEGGRIAGATPVA